MLVSGSGDKTMKLWDVAGGGGRHVRTVDVESAGAVISPH